MINLVIRFRIKIPAKAGISLSPSPFCHPIAIGSSESWNLLRNLFKQTAPLFKCGNLSRYYADLNFKFVIVQVLLIDKDG
jgi:hypothetical protein